VASLNVVGYVIVGLSSGAFGDRYLAPHSVLTSMSRGSTPKDLWTTYGLGKWTTGDIPLEDFDDRDIFQEILDAMDVHGIKVIAYMAAQGPAMLKEGRTGSSYNWNDAESAAYDYDGDKKRSFQPSAYVNAISECSVFGITDGACAPSVWKWRNYVHSVYSPSDALYPAPSYANDESQYTKKS